MPELNLIARLYSIAIFDQVTLSHLHGLISHLKWEVGHIRHPHIIQNCLHLFVFPLESKGNLDRLTDSFDCEGTLEGLTRLLEKSEQFN